MKFSDLKNIGADVLAMIICLFTAVITIIAIYKSPSKANVQLTKEPLVQQCDCIQGCNYMCDSLSDCDEDCIGDTILQCNDSIYREFTYHYDNKELIVDPD